MPIATIHILEGRTDSQKERLIIKMTEAIEEAIGAPRQSIRIIINEMPKQHFGIAGKSARELGK